MLTYCVCSYSYSFIGSEVVEKAVHFLSTIFSHESITNHSILPSTSFVFVQSTPEPYCVCKNLIIVDRDLLIGERVSSNNPRLFIGFCTYLRIPSYDMYVSGLSILWYSGSSSFVVRFMDLYWNSIISCNAFYTICRRMTRMLM